MYLVRRGQRLSPSIVVLRSSAATLFHSAQLFICFKRVKSSILLSLYTHHDLTAFPFHLLPDRISETDGFPLPTLCYSKYTKRETYTIVTEGSTFSFLARVTESAGAGEWAAALHRVMLPHGARPWSTPRVVYP